MVEFKQGVFAPTFDQQFPDMNLLAADILDQCNRAIAQLYVYGLITDAENTKIRHKRFPKLVASAVKGELG